jgi:uncharacterized paraquat-inducible protein A
MTTLIEAAAKKLMTAIALDRHDVGDWPDDSRKAYEALEQAIAQEQSKTIRNCITCKYSHEPANSAVCTDCKHAYTSADHWEPKP